MDRVLEVGGYAAGYCGRLFAQAGCDVARVEAVAGLPPQPPGAVGATALEIYLHAGKQRIAQASTRELGNLARQADVAIVEAPGARAIAALGFDGWETPVRAAITPFGRTGPKRDAPAAPATLLAAAGYTCIMGDPQRPPLTLPGHYPEFQSGGFTFAAANASRLAGERNAIDVGMLETVMALSQFTTVMWHCAGEIRRRHGNDFWHVVPTNLFRCADGWVYVNIVPGFWDAFAACIERPELVLDKRFETNERRREHREALHEIIAAALAPLTKADIQARADAARIPLGVVQSLDDVLADPHLAARNFWQAIATETGAACRNERGEAVRSPRRAWRVNGNPPPSLTLLPAAPADAQCPWATEGSRASIPPTAAPGGATASGGTSANPTCGRRDNAPSPAPAAVGKRSAGGARATGPLRGVRILDLTHVWAGPLATRVLADLGADVVKIEAPMGRGPRVLPTELNLGGWLPEPSGQRPGPASPPKEPWNASAIFVKLQRNKRSVALDLKQAEGRDVFLALAAVADVVIENFSARAMPALGLGYETLRAANSHIIYVAMPGYGTAGPYRDRVAFGPTVEVMSGLTHVLGYSRDEPRCTAMALMDPIAAVNAAAAVVATLRERTATGCGARVELALHESGAAFCGPWLVERQLSGLFPAEPSSLAEGSMERLGNRHPNMAPHGVYPCAGEDAWVAIACRDDGDWQHLCTAVGTGLVGRANLAQRRQMHDAIDAAIAAWTSQRSKAEAERALLAAGVPAGAVNATPDMTADAQVQARGFFVPLEAGGTPMPGNPIKMGGISPADWTPCPKLGADNAPVLREWLGYDSSEVEQLMRRGVLVDKPPA